MPLEHVLPVVVQLFPQPPQLLLFEVVSTQVPPQSVPDEQTQLLAVPEQYFPVPHEPLTQCPLELQVWGTPPLHRVSDGVQSVQAFWMQEHVCVPWEQVPWLLQVPASWISEELRQLVLPHAVLIGNTHSGLDPVQVDAQVPVPLQDLPECGETVFVHVPGVTAHDAHVPVHGLSQQYPSTQLCVEHSDLSEQDSPWFFKVAHVEPVQYLPAPQDAAEQVPEQSLLSAKHWLLSQVVVVWIGQLPWPSHNDLFVRWPPEQLCAAQATELSE